MKHQAKLEAFLGRVTRLSESSYYWSTAKEISHTPPELILNCLRRAKTLTLHVYNEVYAPMSLAVSVKQMYLEGLTDELVVIITPATVEATQYLGQVLRDDSSAIYKDAP